MLKRMRTSSRGVTLIELVIVLAVIGIALTLGAPAYYQWNENSRIRSATESMLNGIKLARSEALKRNTTVRFQLMDSNDSSCKPSPTGLNWIVSELAVTDCSVTDPSLSPFIIRRQSIRPDATTEPSYVAYSASQSGV